MPAIAARLSASVTTTQRQSCVLLAVGACIASRMQSRITPRPTGRVRSSRLRTARVVVSSSSTVAMSMLSLSRISDVDSTRLVDTEHRQGSPQAEEYRDTQCEIKDLGIGEVHAQTAEERVVHRRMVGREALGILDGKTLSQGVTG